MQFYAKNPKRKQQQEASKQIEHLRNWKSMNQHPKLQEVSSHNNSNNNKYELQNLYKLIVIIVKFIKMNQ